MWGGIPERMKEDFIFPNVTPSTNESKPTYGAPTDSTRVTGVIGEETTHQDAHTGIDIGALNLVDPLEYLPSEYSE